LRSRQVSPWPISVDVLTVLNESIVPASRRLRLALIYYNVAPQSHSIGLT
jgi:hypothetical protein